MIEQEILGELNKKEDYFVIGAVGSGKDFLIKSLLLNGMHNKMVEIGNTEELFYKKVDVNVYGDIDIYNYQDVLKDLEFDKDDF